MRNSSAILYGQTRPLRGEESSPNQVPISASSNYRRRESIAGFPSGPLFLFSSPPLRPILSWLSRSSTRPAPILSCDASRTTSTAFVARDETRRSFFVPRAFYPSVTVLTISICGVPRRKWRTGAPRRWRAVRARLVEKNQLISIETTVRERVISNLSRPRNTSVFTRPCTKPSSPSGLFANRRKYFSDKGIANSAVVAAGDERFSVQAG